MKFFRDGQERTQTVTIEELALDVERAPQPAAEGGVELFLQLRRD